MRTPKKIVTLAIALALILVAFAGCGGGNELPTQGNDTQVNNPVATNPPANNQQENNPTTTPLPTDNIPTETPAPTTELEPEDNQPPTERRELNRAEQSHLDTVLHDARRICNDSGCSEEETEIHVEMAREMWLVYVVDNARRDSLNVMISVVDAIRAFHDNGE